MWRIPPTVTLFVCYCTIVFVIYLVVLNRFTISSTYIGDPDADTQDQPGLSPCSLPYLPTFGES